MVWENVDYRKDSSSKKCKIQETHILLRLKRCLGDMIQIYDDFLMFSRGRERVYW